MSRNGPGLYEFLMEAELQQYYPGIRGDLKVQTTAQLKYVTEEDLSAIGMSKPEMRRLKKYFQKHFPQNYLSKFKKMLLSKREEQSSGVLGMLPEERQNKSSVIPLTGHQILEAIDEPNFQRLEQPECCPKDYFTLMQQCWQHEPSKRPKFSELINLLPDLKPEQVQAVQDSTEPGQLVYRQSDIITVLDKGSSNTLWKGVLNNGKTGFFNPAHTIAYLGSNLPSNKPGEFTRGDGKNAFSSQRRKIRTDMISSPQGDLKHTGHVGLDGAYFGDISFLGKYPHLPRQVVTPYKPQEDATDNFSQISTQNTGSVDINRELTTESGSMQQETESKHESLWSDMNSEICHATGNNANKQAMTSNIGSNIDTLGADHEYHEISDEENQDSPLKFDKTLNFDFGPSLLAEMDQMFRSLGSSPPPPGHSLSIEHESSNARNELREIQAKQCNKKKQATVKPISAADQKTLYSAIAMAQELTARSMTDLEHPPESPRTPASPSRRRKFSFKLPHQHSPKPDRRHFSEEAASIPDIQWLCSSLQSLSSTVSSIESLGAPSTLKLPLWDKASAEFCFAKSRELLTKPSAWTSYIDIDLNEHILDKAATKENLIKSTKFWENENRRDHNRRDLKCDGISDVDIKLSVRHQNDKKFNIENLNYDFSHQMKRVSTSYVERYFEQPKYCDDEITLECTSANNEKLYCGEEKLEKKYVKINNLEQPSKLTYSSNIQEQNSPVIVKSNQALQNKSSNCGLNDCNIMHFEARSDENVDILKEDTVNFESSHNKPDKFDVVREKTTNLDLGTRPKIPITFTDSTKINITNFTKKINLSKSRAAKMTFMPRQSSQDVNTVRGLSDSIKTNMKMSSSDSPRSNTETLKTNVQSFRKFEQNQNGHESFPFVISNNPIFITEIEKKESPIYSSSESLRANFQRLRRKSDAEASQVELNSKLLAKKYQREISGLESVKNYLDSKKTHGLNLGLSKLTQNMIQLGKNIAQNSKNLETALPKSLVSNIRNLDLSAPSQTPLQSLNIPIQKPKHLDLNIPLQNQSSINAKLNLIKISNSSTSPTLHQHILEPPKLYQNDPARMELPKLNMLAEKLSDATIYRYRTSSLSESRKPSIKNIRRSFHPTNDSSEDSDSISHSETDIRSRLRYKRRHKKVPHSLRLNFKNRISFLHPDSAKGLSTVELCGKSPPPSTSFLNSLSPPFPSKNNLLSWPESAPSSSLTFTSNSDFDSDTSSEYPEITTDMLTFPPSPAP
ncbi:Tyrosine-protein kinase PR2 [Cyphomyrmex costatus]|uniref:non-specific protein-tyrosine kinase n=1 Tax=Cyphomyrmex costatus TaxID=456900 RepID=A0A151IE12_9HYME|nr:Tyrosine-protein kinase PR2 [Cyphomyrmex costatus]